MSSFTVSSGGTFLGLPLRLGSAEGGACSCRAQVGCQSLAGIDSCGILGQQGQSCYAAGLHHSSGGLNAWPVCSGIGSCTTALPHIYILLLILFKSAL